MPAVFIRTAYCNLHCEWCDAWYTWDHKRLNVNTESWEPNPHELAVWINSQPAKLVVITGGEPLLWDEDLARLISYLKSDKVIQFETNGTRKPKYLSMHRKIKWVVSPKLSTCDPFNRRIKPDVLQWFVKEGAHFKFVVSSPKDINMIKAFGLPNVWLMAQGTTREELDLAMPWLLEECMKHGWRYSDRLHIRAFGDKRGT
jgi:organic radical activating enzyme